MVGWREGVEDWWVYNQEVLDNVVADNITGCVHPYHCAQVLANLRGSTQRVSESFYPIRNKCEHSQVL